MHRRLLYCWRWWHSSLDCHNWTSQIKDVHYHAMFKKKCIYLKFMTLLPLLLSRSLFIVIWISEADVGMTLSISCQWQWHDSPVIAADMPLDTDSTFHLVFCWRLVSWGHFSKRSISRIHVCISVVILFFLKFYMRSVVFFFIPKEQTVIKEPYTIYEICLK